MKLMNILIGLMVLSALSQASPMEPSACHEMQHGFVLAADDRFASHLVATGHHSRQAEITGRLSIDAPADRVIYEERKLMNKDGTSYFLFQAQELDLPSLEAGQILTGHIVESREGSYDSKNIVVKAATFQVEKVLLNIKNPFFGE